ncbi:MHYT domain-containing protein [Bacillus atrophaeus]|nr:MHYT domain-containing protein [Bacillus atrophaeus]MED1029600.1 MHYT domain-containing protein [Bacillus atrophaeus]MED1131455.1 MHYT domain-containing protein [Bacillus atrophaeus]
MHFIGMMAFHTQYEMIPLAASVSAAILGSFVSLYIVSRRTLTFYRLLHRFAYDGGSLASMHFIGMDSISRVIIVYDSFLFTASVLAAIANAFRLFKNFLLFDVQKNI